MKFQYAAGEEMCREMEEIYYEGMEIGEKKVKKETAVSMAEEGMQVERIAKFLKVNVEEVQKWLDAGLCIK